MSLKKWIVASLLLTGFAVILMAQDPATKKMPQAPPMLGIHWAKGMAPARTSNPDMTFHGGTILVTTSAQAIFWGTSWTNPGDKTSDEYTGTNGQVSATVSYGGHFVDTTKASGGNNTSTILAEVCKVIPNPSSDSFYAVYTDLPRKGNYCAYHSYGSCGTTQVQFAFFWKLDGDAGCDPQSTVSGESQGLAAIANVSGHELSETRTDPRNGGWYDANGGENGDKCAWTFNVPYVTFSNGSQWKIQGEWSNHAYDTNTGYPNSSGQDGCLDGH